MKKSRVGENPNLLVEKGCLFFMMLGGNLYRKMKIHFVSSFSPKSRNAYRLMTKVYGQSDIEEADCIVVLSGDGMVLRTFHETYQRNIPIYGSNRGKIGFLTNPYLPHQDLIERIKNAVPFLIHPLKIRVDTREGDTFETIAVNELYLLRQTHQTAKIRIIVDGKRE